MQPDRKASFSLVDFPHRRFNLLSGEWVLVLPGAGDPIRQVRRDPAERAARLQYDPACGFCREPEEGRSGMQASSTARVADDTSPPLRPGTPARRLQRGSLLLAEGEPGISRVICYSSRHDRALPDLDSGEIRAVVDLLAEEYQMLGSRSFVNYVGIFEYRGERRKGVAMHPQMHIMASRAVPPGPAREVRQMAAYRAAHRHCLLCDYLALEGRLKDRIIFENEEFIALVPFWAARPFEILLAGRRHYGSLAGMRDRERDHLAAILGAVTLKYDMLAAAACPYSAWMDQSPSDGTRHPEFHFHMHLFPVIALKECADPGRSGVPAGALCGSPAEACAALLRETPGAHPGRKAAGSLPPESVHGTLHGAQLHHTTRNLQ